MKNALLFFCIFCLTKQLSAQMPAVQTWVIISYIKESSKNDYEKWMTDIFFAPMQSSQDPVLKKQFSTARWQKPVRQNENKTWTYGILLDPVIPNADYDIESFLVKTYGEAKGKNYMKQYEGFMASEGQIHFFEMSKGLTTPSVSSDEEAIKKVIIDETTAWANHDTTAFFAAYADNELTQGAWNNTNLSFGTYKGMETIKKSVRDDLKANPNKFYQPNIERSNWLIKVLSPEWAWVNFTQKTKNVREQINTSYETRLMHKEGGKWRINVVNALWDYKNVAQPAVNPDEKDIQKVVLDEGIAFSQGNIDAFMATYNASPNILWTVTNGMEPGDVLTFRGYDALKAFAQSLPWFKNFKPENNQKVPTDSTLRDNWSFQFKGNIAIVNFDEHWVNDKEKSKVDVTCIKILEKVNGQWKINNTAALADFKDATPPIRTKY